MQSLFQTSFGKRKGAAQVVDVDGELLSRLDQQFSLQLCLRVTGESFHDPESQGVFNTASLFRSHLKTIRSESPDF